MTIKVVSLNLWWGGNLFPDILDFLKLAAADIVLLQEVHDGSGAQFLYRQRSMEILRANLDYEHHDFATAFTLKAPQGQLPLGNAILTRFPIRESSSSFLFEPSRAVFEDVPEQWPIFPRLLQQATLKTPDGEVNVLNMHGVWDLDGDNDSPTRRRMVNTIIEEIAEKPNVILAGDTNAKATNPVWRPLEEQLNSVFGDQLRSTFNMRRKDNPGYASAAVDLMFVSPNIKILSAECPDVDISDHLPLVAMLDVS